MILKFGKWPVFYKIMVTTIVIVALTLGIATLVHANILRARVQEEAGAKVAVLADGRMGYIADALVEQLALLRAMALDGALTAAVQTANADYSGSAAEIESALLEVDRRWLAAADNDELIQAGINPALNPAAAQLLAYAAALPAHGELFITDRYGGLVAATGRLSDYYQADEAWWQSAYDSGLGAFYIGQPAYDESAGYIALTMAAPILSSQDGAVIGILRSTVNIDFLSAAFQTPVEGQMGVTLVNGQRLILAESNVQRVGQTVPASWMLDSARVGAMWFQDRNTDGQAVVVGRAALDDALISNESIAKAVYRLNWYLFAYQPQTAVYARIRGGVWTMIGVLALLLLVAAAAAWWAARSLSRPVLQLRTVMRRWLDGDRPQRAQPYWPDETGELAETFNTMAANVQEMDEALSQRASEREREEQRRARELEATTVVGEIVSVTADVTTLAQGVVDLLRERFGLYYTGLYLLDDAGKWLVLHAGSGDPARQMLVQDYRVAIGEWVVGRCVAEEKTTIARHTDADSALLFDRSQLPHTHTAVAMPLRSRGRIFGAIEVHSDQAEMLDAESAVVLQTIADQVAVAIDSVQLYAERQEAMERLEHAYSGVTREAWEALLSARTTGPEGYQAETRRIMPLAAAPPEAWRPAARVAWSEGRVVVEESVTDQTPASVESTLALPIRLRDEILGVVDVSKRRDAGKWKPDEIAQLEQLVGQLGLTLEVSRFYQESRRAAAREQLLREVSERIRVAVDVDTVMRIAAQEVGEVLKRPVFVYLENEPGQQISASATPATPPETREHE
ncbi:MAG: GAF domain-containing protein [Anaerolineae bacterium]|nr:GAF domain-containing protein [Anaerolineae bacterium]